MANTEEPKEGKTKEPREELPEEVDDIFEPAQQPKFNFRCLILHGATGIMGTANNLESDDIILVLKLTFVHEPDYKIFVRLTLNIRSGNDRNRDNILQNPTDLQ